MKEDRQSWEEKLRGIAGWSIEQSKVIEAFLRCACNYGAGDALAGSMLNQMPVEVICAVSDFLQLERPSNPKRGCTAAMLMLREKSASALIQEVLDELHLLSCSGMGCGQGGLYDDNEACRGSASKKERE